MMLLGSMGLGLLGNLITQAGMNTNINSPANKQMIADVQAQLDEATQACYQQTQNPWDPKTAYQPFLEANAPPFPDQAANKLATMQQDNAAERDDYVQQTGDEIQRMRDEFFAHNHLETTEQPATAQTPAQQQVSLNEQGRPQVQQGAETPDQKSARQAYEDDTRAQLSDKHQQQQDTFNQQEKDNITSFLQNNKPDLGNPAVQSELQKMVSQTYKKALNLSRDQQGEVLKSNLYTPEQTDFADSRLDGLRAMEDRHAEMEDNSPEAGELMQHQQDLAELMSQKRSEIQASNMEDAFLKGPPQFGNQNTRPVDVATVLPPYLSHALYNMGIYSV